MGLAQYKDQLSVGSTDPADKVVEKVIKLIGDLAYPRVAGGNPVIWNGVTDTGSSCSAKAKNKRQLEACCMFPLYYG
jgi:hypothetical protein